MTTESQEGTDRTDRLGAAERWGPWVVCCLAIASLPWLVHELYDPVLRTGDGAVYLLTGKSLLAGEGYRYLGEPFVIRPPGFPLLLTPVLGLFGDDLYTLHVYVALWGAIALGLFVAFYRPRLGIRTSAALAAVVWLNPTFRELSTDVMSDVPGLAVLFGCLLVERWARARPSTSRDLVLALCIGFGGYVRSVVLLLVPAILGARLLARWTGSQPVPSSPRDPRALAMQLLPILILSVLVQLPWELRNSGAERSVPAEHTLFYSYAVAMWHTDRADPDSPRLGAAEFLERVQRRVREVTRELNGRLRHEGRGSWYPIPVLLGLGCWLFIAWRRRESVDVYIGLLLALYFVYFGFAYRLVLPLYVLLLASVADVGLRSVASFAGRMTAEVVMVGLLLVLAWADFRSPGEAREAIAERHADSERVVAYLGEHFQPDEALGAEFGGHLSVALDRPVYTLRWSVKRGGREAALDFIERHRLAGLVLDSRERSGRALRPVLERRHGCEWELGADVCIVRLPR